MIAGIIVLGYSSALPYLVRVILGPQTLFYINGGLSALFVGFIVFFIKETSHLTDKEKKRLYSPRSERHKLIT